MQFHKIIPELLTHDFNSTLLRKNRSFSLVIELLNLNGCLFVNASNLPWPSFSREVAGLRVSASILVLEWKDFLLATPVIRSLSFEQISFYNIETEEKDDCGYYRNLVNQKFTFGGLFQL